MFALQEGHMDDEMDEAGKLAAELGLSEQFDDAEEAEKIGQELIEQLVEHDRTPKVELYAAMNVVAWALHQAPDEEQQAFCDEARADLDEIIKAVLTPNSVFETRARRTKFKIVRNEDAG
jgi:hypothetical protein